MIAALARLATGSPLVPVAMLALVVSGALAFASHQQRGALADARQAAGEAARAERDAHWRGQIAAASAAARARQIAAENDAARSDAAAGAAIARLTSSLADQEARNAAIPDRGDCGLDRDRVRLLSPAR